MNRLDEIEQNLGGLTSRGASAFLSLNDIFALVAVARAAAKYRESVAFHARARDTESSVQAIWDAVRERGLAEEELRAALAPLLAEKEG